MDKPEYYVMDYNKDIVARRIGNDIRGFDYSTNTWERDADFAYRHFYHSFDASEITEEEARERIERAGGSFAE